MKMDTDLIPTPAVGLTEEEEADMNEWKLPLAFMKKRHLEKIEGSKALAQSWRMKDRVNIRLRFCFSAAAVGAGSGTRLDWSGPVHGNRSLPVWKPVSGFSSSPLRVGVGVGVGGSLLLGRTSTEKEANLSKFGWISEPFPTSRVHVDPEVD